jgi:hypothetical protein
MPRVGGFPNYCTMLQHCKEGNFVYWFCRACGAGMAFNTDEKGNKKLLAELEEKGTPECVPLDLVEEYR